MTLVEEAQKAARLLLDHAYVRILARDEADAVCAAALLGHALRRQNIDFHVSWAPALTAAHAARIAEDRPDCLVTLGLAGDAQATIQARRIALDREPAAPGAEATLDAREGADAPSLSALAHLVAVAMSKRDRDLAPIAIAGARATGETSELDEAIERESEELRLVVKEARLALTGPTLAEALAQLDAPYVAGVTGRARNVRKVLADLQLSADAPPGDLSPPDAQRLGDLLALRLLQQHAPDAAIDALTRPGARALQGPCVGLEASDLARLVETTCAAGHPGLAFAALWPDEGLAHEIRETANATRDELVAALTRAEREARHEGRLVLVESPKASLCAPLARRVGLAMVPDGRVAVVHHADAQTTTVALRSRPGGPDAAAVARYAANVAGARARGTHEAALVTAPHADVGRVLKAIAEALP